MDKKIAETKIEFIKGDITAQRDITAVVNAANAQLMPGGGVAGAIHRAAGPGLAEECSMLSPIKPGEAVITSGHKLPNKHVIHCLGPVYGRDKPEDKILSQCYINALNLTHRYNIDSIAFPSISTGIFGYPVEEAAAVVCKTIHGMIFAKEYVKKIRFVLYSESDLKVYEKAWSKICS